MFESTRPPPPDCHSLQERIDRFIVFREAESADHAGIADLQTESYVAKAEAVAAYRRCLMRGAPPVIKNVFSTAAAEPYPLSVFEASAAAGSCTAQLLFDLKMKGLMAVDPAT